MVRNDRQQLVISKTAEIRKTHAYLVCFMTAAYNFTLAYNNIYVENISICDSSVRTATKATYIIIYYGQDTYISARNISITIDHGNSTFFLLFFFVTIF